MKFVTPYTPEEKREDLATINKEESMTVQSDAEDADINIIMKKYNTTGVLTGLNLEALTGDFSDVGDFREAQDKIKTAREEFAKVPAQLRRRFDNDPQQFIDFVLDDANREETIKLGLRNPPPPPPTVSESAEPKKD
jgi:phage internal scaffolding protein